MKLTESLGVPSIVAESTAKLAPREASAPGLSAGGKSCEIPINFAVILFTPH